MSGIRISNRRVLQRDGRATLAYDIENGPVDVLHYTSASPFCDGYNAPLVAILPFAMARGLDVVVEGEVSALLLANLRTGVMPILRRQMPQLQYVELTATPARWHSCSGPVVTGLSCGVDSLSAAKTYLEHECDDLRITHFSFYDAGSHGPGDKTALYEARLAKVRQAAGELGRPLIEVRTNLSSLWVKDFQQHHTLWNTSVAMALGFGTYLYSSTYSYSDIGVYGCKDIAHADPIILPLLSGGGPMCVSANADMRRVDKTAIIATDAFAQRWLDVCVHSEDGTNCSKCWKCARTLLTLDILGHLDAFGNVFDLDVYRSIKAEYVGEVLLDQRDGLLAEILELAGERGVRLATPETRLRAERRRAYRTLKKVVPANTVRSLRRASVALRSRLSDLSLDRAEPAVSGEARRAEG